MHPHSRRTTQVGNCRGAIRSGQIFASAPQTAFPELANLPDESSGADRGHRFFHRADGDLPGPIRFRPVIAGATPGDFAAMTRDIGMKEVLTAPRSPWQNPICGTTGGLNPSRVSGPRDRVEREIVATNSLQLFCYYQRSRTHLALGKDAPERRAVEPPEQGRVVAIPQVGGDYTSDISASLLSRSKPVASTFAFLERK